MISDSNTLKLTIKNFAVSLGFDDIGIASADGPLPYLDDFKRAEDEGRFGPLDYLYRTKEQRSNILSVLPGAKTVIIFLKNYYTNDHKDVDKTNHFYRPKIARYAWGKDYHQWFKKRLKAFGPFLSEIAGREVKTYSFNDTGPVLERAWAMKSGLGFIGKSSLFINRQFGTWTLIGGLVTELYISEDEPYQGPTCGSCTRCIDACPTKAIVKPYALDAKKCLSTWTIERPLHPEVFRSKSPKQEAWVFGCDICQEVCPWNKFQTKTTEERFQAIPGRLFLSSEIFSQDLRGSPLYRSTKPGLLLNFLRIRQSMRQKNLKVF